MRSRRSTATSHPTAATPPTTRSITSPTPSSGSADSEKLVTALEATDYVGTIGRIQFKGKDTPNPHALKVGSDTITGLMLQWQDGKQVNLWPANVANGNLKFPKFIKV